MSKPSLNVCPVCGGINAHLTIGATLKAAMAHIKALEASFKNLQGACANEGPYVAKTRAALKAALQACKRQAV